MQYSNKVIGDIARAFWRRIEPYKNDFEKELPEKVPVEFMSFMGTALSILQRHDCGGLTDELTKGVCEGMYGDKCDDVIALHCALNEVYALAGDVDGVKEIVETAIKNYTN